MSADPKERLLRALLRKRLDAELDFLRDLPEAASLAPGGGLTVVTADEGFQLQLTVVRLLSAPPSPAPTVPIAAPAPPGAAAPARPEEMKTIHRCLLAKAVEFAAPVKARKLILSTRYKYNTNSRDAVTWLLRNGFLARDDGDHYFPTGKALALYPRPA